VTVDIDAFVENMEAHWMSYPSRRTRVCTPALRRLWQQIGVVFNQQIVAPSDAFPAIPAELGAGKTTGAKTWCSMLPTDQRAPGVMMVVPMIRDAERAASDINAWAGAPVALAYHSDLDLAVRRDYAALAAWPILIICHKGYEMGLDRYAMSDTYAKFEAMHAFRGGRRALVIVDESLHLVHQARLKLGDLEDVMATLDSKPLRTTMRQHLDAYDVIASVRRAIMVAPDGDRVELRPEDLLGRVRVAPSEADTLLQALWDGGIQTLKGLHRETRAKIGDALAAIRRHLVFYRWSDGNGQITGARLLLPEEAAMVVLDATAELNPVYRTKYYALVDKLERVRDYSAATQYVIRRSGTGIRAMQTEGEGIARETLELVLQHYGQRAAERDVLVVTNKGSEAQVREIWTAGNAFKTVTVAHWGDTAGRSDFSGCDTIVTLTLPYGEMSHDLADRNALYEREALDEDDMVRAIRECRMASELAQVNARICIRDLTREDGVCDAADMFNCLPNWDKVIRTDVVLGEMQRVLRGLRVVELYREPLNDYSDYAPLFTKVGPLVKPEDVSIRTWRRITADARKAGTPLNQAMQRAGVEHVVVGGKDYIREAGTTTLTPSEAMVVDFAEGIQPGTEAPLSACGLSEHARRRALKRPVVQAAFKVLGIKVRVLAPRLGGVTLAR
jgi:hypothetical protein